VTHLVHPITIQTYRQAAQILGKAFEDDPVSVAVYKGFSPSKRVRALTFDFSTELLLCIRKGHPIQVNENDKMVAAAVIYPPGAYPLPVIDQWLILLKSILGNGWYDIKAWNKWLIEVDKNHPTEAHFYLEYLGVEPEYQGMGFGSSILKYLNTKADEAGVGCYLENANPRNISFYQQAGFQIIGELEIIAIPTWFMWRPPNKA
jgi:ribosomal protein S18 acetylase RimI-like enzyme